MMKIRAEKQRPVGRVQNQHLRPPAATGARKIGPDGKCGTRQGRRHALQTSLMAGALVSTRRKGPLAEQCGEQGRQRRRGVRPRAGGMLGKQSGRTIAMPSRGGSTEGSRAPRGTVAVATSSRCLRGAGCRISESGTSTTTPATTSHGRSWGSELHRAPTHRWRSPPRPFRSRSYGPLLPPATNRRTPPRLRSGAIVSQRRVAGRAGAGAGKALAVATGAVAATAAAGGRAGAGPEMWHGTLVGHLADCIAVAAGMRSRARQRDMVKLASRHGALCWMWHPFGYLLAMSARNVTKQRHGQVGLHIMVLCA